MAKTNNNKEIKIVLPGLRTTKPVKCGSMIIKHKTWDYDENHKLIIVDGDKEDRQAMIEEEAKVSGLKNVLKGLIDSQDVVGLRSLALQPGQFGDTTIEASLNVDTVRRAQARGNDSERLAKQSAEFGKTPDEMLKISKSELDEIINKKVAEIMSAQKEKVNE